MSIELKIPELGESIQEVQIGKWLKQPGDAVEQDEDIVELETDKASMELPAPAAGVLAEILKQEGDTVSVGDVIAYVDEEAEVGSTDEPSSDVDEPSPSDETEGQEDQQDSEQPSHTRRGDQGDGGRRPAGKPVEETVDSAAGDTSPEGVATRQAPETESPDAFPATPAARRALRAHGLTPRDVKPSGERLRLEDVQRHVETASAPPEEGPDGDTAVEPESPESPESQLEEAVPMSLIRRRIAQRLVEAQQKAALLTTFNEIDMSAVIGLRQQYRDQFRDEYGVSLGFMPFFVKAVIDALRHVPEVNAEIRDTQMIYRNYYHIGIAVGGGKGLVVPVLRFAERMSFAEIEEAIDDFARRAETNELEPDELQGGTFTITNGGVYGSLLSTPIVNPPQSGVLGMHVIQQRPVARDGQVVIRPMMYVALTYDHRIVDGREAVSFLKRVKESIEEPTRMLIEV